MKLLSRIAGTLLLLACLLQPAVGSAVILGQIDDFQDHTTQGWGIGAITDDPVPPVNNPDGGPAGAGDAFLQLTAIGGTGPGSKLTVNNDNQQWAGDYLAAGVSAITMRVKNLGTTDLSLRLYVTDFAIRPPLPPGTNAALSTKAVLLPAGGGWTSVVFPIAPANLTATNGSVTAALSNAAELRLFHNPAPAFPGPAVQAQLGVDNIHAVRGVPLPFLPLLLLDGPVVKISVKPTTIWPPNHGAVAVTLTGTVTQQSGCSLIEAFYYLTDEYGANQAGSLTVGPDGNFTTTVYVEAWRNSTDLDGRHYSFTVTATNQDGTGTSNTAVCIVPYQQP